MFAFSTRRRAKAWPMIALLLAAPLLAHAAPPLRESLGVFGGWAAFRDAGVPRCYAIAKPEREPGHGGGVSYADIAIWPRQGVRGVLHLHLARRIAPGTGMMLDLGGHRFRLSTAPADNAPAGNATDAWSADPQMDAAILAALRAQPSMVLHASDGANHAITARWSLSGAASAIDAALVGCAGLK